ncbi:MAG TPA: class I tRNA ligase family protein [Thermoplasmata archaeon]|nr:class I tRNA ligase family protein [Thermoplasmata archaeon]
MVFTFRDSLTGKVLPLAAPAHRPLTMYICGPTVYDASHVGHGRTYLYFDTLRRALHDRGVVTRVVRNITDYEDKVTWRAEALGVTWRQLARTEERRFREDLGRLRILPVDVEPRASQFVPQMISVGRRLERTGRVERRDDTWVYRPPPPSGRNFAEGDDFKRHVVPEPGHPVGDVEAQAREIVVWHRQESPNATWPSPWGRGAPGWHLECYAMARQYLGIPVDFHGGGTDLIFPHHYAENEIALALDGDLFARRFLHTGFVTQLHRKMSKSRGNLVPLRAALDEFGACALRWYLLTPPYNARLEWSAAEARRSMGEWEEVRLRLREVTQPGAGGNLAAKRLEGLADRVRDCIEDGFGVSAALDEIRCYAAEVGAAGSSHLQRGEASRGRRSVRRIEALLGLNILS